MGTHLLSLKSNLQRKKTTMGAVEKKGRGRPKMTAEQKAAKAAMPKAGRPRTLTDEGRAEREAARKAKIDVRRIPRQGFHLRKDLTDEQKDEIRAMIQADKDKRDAAKVPGRGRGRPKLTDEEKAALPKRGRAKTLTDEERAERAEARKYVPTGKPRGRPKKAD